LRHSVQSVNIDNNQKKHHKKIVKNGRTYADGILIVNKGYALPPTYNPSEYPKAQK
jgi:D-alanyl-D-alanine carboxypeptidase